MIHGSYMDHNDSWTIHYESFANIVYTLSLSLIPRWYYSNLTGREAETLLFAKGQDGSFLVRNSAHNPGCYVLSVRVNERVSHIIIHNKRGVFYVGGGSTVDNYVFAKRVDEHVSDVVISNVFDGGSVMFDDTRMIYAEIGSRSGFTFGSLTLLIEHYKMKPMVETTGSVIHLKHPFLPANLSQQSLNYNVVSRVV